MFVISRCKLVYTGRINNKVLLYSTTNDSPHPVINHKGKEYEKEYICITKLLCCIAETANQLYFRKIFYKSLFQISNAHPQGQTINTDTQFFFSSNRYLSIHLSIHPSICLSTVPKVLTIQYKQ